MAPFFYHKDIPNSTGRFLLDEATSKHCIQVLRMTAGADLQLTDGKGKLAKAMIQIADKRNCLITITSVCQAKTSHNRGFTIGIAFTKNKTRNEWLLEKMTEVGCRDIFPILTEHSERNFINKDRYKKVMISALIQSQQIFLPTLHPIIKFSEFLKTLKPNDNEQRLIAHCMKEEEDKKSLLSVLKKNKKCLMLIGPEGDFSPTEIEQSLQSGFIPVHLGQNRLRTETAGLYACIIYNTFQDDRA